MKSNQQILSRNHESKLTFSLLLFSSSLFLFFFFLLFFTPFSSYSFSLFVLLHLLSTPLPQHSIPWCVLSNCASVYWNWADLCCLLSTPLPQHSDTLTCSVILCVDILELSRLVLVHGEIAFLGIERIKLG